MVLDPRLSRLRLGPFRKGAFRSRLHDERTAAILGISLGVSFGLCFATGLLSHLIQYPPSWFEWPARPAGLYRVTQGVHVAAGIASVPLLLAKLWTVYPRLWQWPPVASVLHAIERISLIPLVAGSVFLLFTGMADIGLWYPWLFFFPIAHYWAAWITIGALVIHIGAKATIARRALAHREPREESGGLTRRGLLGVAFGAAGLLTLVTIGQTLRPLNRLALLAPRRPDIGPQGFPVNKTAAGAGVEAAALAAGYRLEVVGRVGTPLSLTLDDLRALPLRTTELPIACVEGWSASVVWRGVPVRDLLAMAGAPAGASVRVESLQEGGLYRTSELNPSHAQDPDALLALDVGDRPLHIDHGYPVRFVGPNRPGVMQTKWVTRLVVL